MRRVAVGDIHGEAHLLAAFVAWLATQEQPLELIFLGDYVGKGPDSSEVISELIRLSRTYDSIFLMGNHDYNFLTAIRNVNADALLTNDAAPIIRSYINTLEPTTATWRDALFSQIPEDHVHSLEKLDLSYEDDGYLYCHAGIDPQHPEARDINSVVLTSHPEIFQQVEPQPGRRLVCGHYIQRGKLPFVSGYVVCLDTGAGSVEGAPLTAMFMDTLEYVQFWRS
ncbi:metallophosphoesterase [Rathayibacter festucae]|uniref:metallophosphoesterase n=1 Tax=Rathayibacter festucae TaxID=110937 RepID=UPI003557B93A